MAVQPTEKLTPLLRQTDNDLLRWRFIHKRQALRVHHHLLEASDRFLVAFHSFISLIQGRCGLLLLLLLFLSVGWFRFHSLRISVSVQRLVNFFRGRYEPTMIGK